MFEWLGTNGGREVRWANPLRLHGIVKLLSSDSRLNQDPVNIGSVLMTRVSKSVDRIVRNDPVKSWRSFHKSCSPYLTRTKSCFSTSLCGVCIRPCSSTAWSSHATAWIMFDLGMQLELSHYLIQVPVHGEKWPRLFDWQIQVEKLVGVHSVDALISLIISSIPSNCLLNDYIALFLWIMVTAGLISTTLLGTLT